MSSSPAMQIAGLFLWYDSYNQQTHVSRFLKSTQAFSDFYVFQSNILFLPLLKSKLMQNLTLLDGPKFQITIKRLCHQLIENHTDFSNSVILGIQPRGIYLADRIASELKSILPQANILNGNLDITFFRDDFRRRESPLVPNTTKIDFIIEGKKVILVDDVLWTGRTIRSAMDAMMAFGRPEKVELLVLVDRRFSRHLPIEPDYIGIQVDSINSQKVLVSWKETDQEDKVILLSGK